MSDVFGFFIFSFAMQICYSALRWFSSILSSTKLANCHNKKGDGKMNKWDKQGQVDQKGAMCELSDECLTDRPTNWPNDRPTNQPTNQRTQPVIEVLFQTQKDKTWYPTEKLSPVAVPVGGQRQLCRWAGAVIG